MLWESQDMVEHFFNARQTPHLLRHELNQNKKACELIAKSKLNEEFAFDLLAQMVIYKRAHVSTLIGLLKKHFQTSDPHQSCAEALTIACAYWLVDWDNARDQFIILHDVSEKAMGLIRQYQYMPPMIVPPLTVRSNKGSGYINIKEDSLILQNNHHEGDICLDSINKFNNIPMSINAEIVKLIRNSWKNLDKPKACETFEDFQKRTKAFERFERDAFFTIALMIEMGNEFYFTHKVDKRGRTYCQGYHINYQGNCWSKAILELAEKEIVNG